MVEQPVENVFSRAWALLTRNWIIVVPGVAIGIVVGIIKQLLSQPAIVYTGDGGFAVSRSFGIGGGLLFGLIALIGVIATIAYTTGMAGAAWRRGTALLGDGTVAFEHDAGRIVLVTLAMIGLALVAAVLAPFTIGLSFLAYLLFTLYVYPSAIVGDRPGFTSITESFQLAIARFVPTLIVAIVIAVLIILGNVIALFFRFTPFIGPVIAAVITQLAVAYGTLVVVGEYLNLQGANPGGPDRPS
jgi:hypothetical protein